MFEKSITTLGKANKSRLRAYYNQRFNTTARSITQIRRQLNEETDADAWQWLTTEYNVEVEQRRVPPAPRIGIKQQRLNYTANLQNYLTGLEVGGDVEINLTEIRKLFGLTKFMAILLQRLTAIFSTRADHIVIRVNDEYYTINDKTRQRLIDFVMNNLVVSEETYESDGLVALELTTAETLTILNVPKTNKNEKQSGAFFKYSNMTAFDFSKYGVFFDNRGDYSDTCLLYALRKGGLEDTIVDSLKLIVKNRCVPLTDLNKICDMAKIQIRLKKDGDTSRQKDENTYGKQYNRQFHIGLIDKHYFIIDNTDITSFALTNYDEIKDLPDYQHITRKKGNNYYRESERVIDSFKAIKLLLEHKDKLLKEIGYDNTNIASTQFYDKANKTIINLEYDASVCIKPVEPKESNEKKVFVNVFYDFETYVKKIPFINQFGEKKIQSLHTPYLCRTSCDGIGKAFYGEDCGYKMLCSLKSNTRLIAHNATYDYRFLIQYLDRIDEISRGNHLIGGSAYFTPSKIHIKVKDSYNLISMPLRNFANTFKLTGMIKEVMPYSLYTEETIASKFVDIKYVCEGLDEFGNRFIRDDEKQQFLDNIKRWNLEIDNKYDIIAYSSKYCEIDCLILEQGYNIFRKWLLDCVHIDIDSLMTIASLAHTYFVNEGCYDDVNLLSGNPQHFIQGCVVGGRVMMSENKKRKYLDTRAKNDFDATSLYPSAMSRMKGFLKGIPKVITNLDYNQIRDYDGYFVDIVITGVGIRRKFPLMSAMSESGVRVFTNDMVGKTMRVDKTTLEDMITYHNVTFDVIRGYYFNEGYNTQIIESINYIFEERLRQKKMKNPVEMIYKLIMNSGYGKSIMKPIETETKIFDNYDRFLTFFSRNYNYVNSFIRFGDKVKVKVVKTLNEHFNICQVGVEILSMSKRIMNEVMTLAEDNNIEMFYQDTDSIHLYDDTIEKLSSLFSAKYGRDLIGKKMGQFHSDFDIKGAENIIASRSIFLGKKCYIDELQGTDEKTGEVVTDYHIRMKGIPNAVIKHTCDKLGYKTPFDLYLDLFDGKPISFDLTNGGSKSNFVFNTNYSVETNTDFVRKIRF